MMPCPECGAKSRVLETRMTDKGWPLRRRICNECPARWNTYELPEDELNFGEDDE